MAAAAGNCRHVEEEAADGRWTLAAAASAAGLVCMAGTLAWRQFLSRAGFRGQDRPRRS
jgi:hypothetical protein